MIHNTGITKKHSCNPNWTRKTILKQPFTLTKARAFFYIDCTNLSNKPSILSFLKGH